MFENWKCPFFDSPEISCLSRYQKTLWKASFGCKLLLNYTYHNMKFHNYYHANRRPSRTRKERKELSAPNAPMGLRWENMRRLQWAKLNGHSWAVQCWEGKQQYSLDSLYWCTAWIRGLVSFFYALLVAFSIWRILDTYSALNLGQF